jgi:predicted regulator of Ras-like GTPase activity (Roadblock/LC7/MglB family)
VNATSAYDPQDIAWLLQGLSEEVPVIRGSVLLSSDGMLKAAHGLDRDNSERLSALAAGLFSMARSAGAKFDGSDAVRQVVAELYSSQLYICWAGFNSVLAVLAEKEADPSVVGFQMAQLIKAVRPFLDTAARHAAAGGANRRIS